MLSVNLQPRHHVLHCCFEFLRVARVTEHCIQIMFATVIGLPFKTRGFLWQARTSHIKQDPGLRGLGMERRLSREEIIDSRFK